MKYIVASASLGVAASAVVRSQSKTQTGANPIRRVVKLLEKLQGEVEKEAEKEEELYKKFECYCKNSSNDLDGSIATATQAVPQLESEIKAATGAKQQLDEELVQHKADREDAKAAIAKATKLRAEEKADFDKVSGDFKQNIAALDGAVDALKQGMGVGFLQTSANAQLKKLLANSTLTLERYARAELTSFLGTGEAPAGGSSEIVGILKQMKEDMDKDLGGVFSKEEASIKAFKGMVAAKEKEIQAHTEAIEAKTARSGELAVEIVNKKNEKEDTADALSEDQKFLAELKEGCDNKEGEWAERQKTRAEELAAIADTIKVLNDDDALDLFNRTLKKPQSLLQVDNTANVRARALSLVNSKNASLANNFLALALQGKKVGFGKVLKMIDDMVATLKQEQKDDEAHLQYCNAELDSSDDKSKELKRNNDSLANSIEDDKEAIAQLSDEIKILKDGIEELDKQVAEATETRKEENADFTALVANNSAAKDLISWAKNRLNKFYNPSLHTTTPPPEMTEEERLFVANGGELSTTPAPQGIAGTGIGLPPAFVQIRSHSSENEKPADAPDTWEGDYKKKSQQSNGVIAMMDMLVKELEKETQEAEHDEKTAQRDYEKLMQDAKDKRAADSKTITEKQSSRADAENNVQASSASLKSGKAELLATHEYMQNLHAECDFLLNNFDLRKEARAQEVAGLQNAKAVLHGADFK